MSLFEQEVTECRLSVSSVNFFHSFQEKCTQKAQGTLKDKNKGDSFAGALDFASKEARSVVLRSKIGGQNPQVKIEKNTKTALAEAKCNNELVAQLIAETGSQTVVSFN